MKTTGIQASAGSRRGTVRALVLATALLTLSAGCATTASNPQDPLEGYNRAMFSFNDGVDRALIKPAAQAYEAVLPSPVRTGVGNVFGNIGDPWIGINNLLQGKVADALSDLMRFLVNSTFGFAGILDVASEMGLPKHDEDLGQTLGSWGVGEGVYVVLPFFGPRTVRDAVALPVDMMGDDVWGITHIPTRNTLTAVRLVHARSRVLGIDRTLEEGTLDKYSYVRDFYLEQRRYKVFDGNPPRVYEDFNGDEPSGSSLGREIDAVASSAVEDLELLGVGEVVMLGDTKSHPN
ncbi:MAG: VacJ family lipoprotein [Azoarcus sp.]|nr:VacJ family lipoprotein [Azoarcus sp.]